MAKTKEGSRNIPIMVDPSFKIFIFMLIIRQDMGRDMEDKWIIVVVYYEKIADITNHASEFDGQITNSPIPIYLWRQLFIIIPHFNLPHLQMHLCSSFSASFDHIFSAFLSPMDVEEDKPEHLLVLVHGILASPSDWTYAQAELKKRLGRNFVIYASSCNTFTKTFTGIDGAGKRLADEVMLVVKKRERTLKKITFLAHSLGGLIARYALALLYTDDHVAANTNFNPKGLIAGLEPINFITLATPHLGVRGKKQLPFLFGVPILEKLAAPIAPFLAGQTGRQLFLTDGKPNKPPLLLRMASDCDDGKFISALGAFKCRVLYANVSYDHMVGWRTSSIRRETELCRPPRRSLDGYKHVVDMEYCPAVPSEGPHFPPEAAKAKEAAQNATSKQTTLAYHEIMEEEMIRGLQQFSWKKVDVSFHSAFWPFFAHNNIHVKNEWFHNAGAGVIAHVADHIKQQEKQQECPLFITASL